MKTKHNRLEIPFLFLDQCRKNINIYSPRRQISNISWLGECLISANQRAIGMSYTIKGFMCGYQEA